MTPQSSDGETYDGCSSEIFPMETSTDVASSLLGKGTVETPNPDEDSDESEGVDEEENSDTDWDKDSFDGVEYNSDHHSEDSDGEFQKKCRNYDRAVIETKGFFEESDDFPAFLWAGIAPVPDLDGEFRNGITNREFIGNMVSECVDKYNKRNKKNLIYERVLRANFHPGGRTTYYVTIAARESPDAPLAEYQAKVVWFAGKSYPIFCRPSPMVQNRGLNVKLEHIKRANFDPGSMSKFYITFTAKESDCSGAPLVEYQAKAAWSVSDKTYPIFCRPSPPPTRIMEEIN